MARTAVAGYARCSTDLRHARGLAEEREVSWLPVPLTRDVITVSRRLDDAEERLRRAAPPPGAEGIRRTGRSTTLRVVAPRWKRIPFRPTLVRITIADSEDGSCRPGVLCALLGLRGCSPTGIRSRPLAGPRAEEGACRRRGYWRDEPDLAPIPTVYGPRKREVWRVTRRPNKELKLTEPSIM